MSKKSDLPSRRKFLTGAGITAAAVACAGSAGKDGIDGINGTNGTNGKDGVPGVDGVNGTNGANCTNAPNGLNTIPTSWDLEADVVVIGSGAAGMVAALAARSKGASVLVVEANYDVGGHCITSGGMVDLGGGNALQNQFNVTDSADLVFRDLTLPASYVPAATPGYFPGLKWAQYGGPLQDRAMCRAYADNNVPACKFLEDNGIQWKQAIDTGHWNGASSIPRTHYPLWKGVQGNPAAPDSPTGGNGVGYTRPLEISARNNGIKFLLNYRVSNIYRDKAFEGNVRGVQADYTGGRIPPGSTTKLQPYCTLAGSLVPNVGNVVDPASTNPPATFQIKANKGVFVATGGASSNVALRKVFDMRMCDVYQVGGEPYSYQTGDGILLSQKIGASLYATGNETSGDTQGTGGAQITKPGWIGCQYGYGSIHFVSTSPVYPFARAGGLGSVNYQNGFQVNMVGQRFVDETAGSYTWVDAAMQPNAGSKPPDFSAGPVWFIFDANAVVKQGWTLAGNTDPAFFFTANDMAGLAAQINTNKYQVSPMSGATLEATRVKYNGFVAAGADTDYGKTITAGTTLQVNTPPYYAAFATPTIHDWLTGIRIDAGAHVLDLDGKIIPGLYAAGEDVGGMVMHGLAKCAVFGMIGGYNAGLGT
ncbi:MAG TPA: FAD-binding protein [Myxococcales bacterium]|nr:FAD-binding protein [Myxococcales bacterium]